MIGKCQMLFFFSLKNNKAYLWSYTLDQVLYFKVSTFHTHTHKMLGAHFRVEKIFSIPIQLTLIQVSFHS